MKKNAFDVKRWIVAAIGVFAIMFALFQFARLGFDEAVKVPITGICTKLGLVFIALSLAWSGLKTIFDRMPASIGYSMLAALLLMIIRPKAAIWALAILAVTALANFVIKIAVRKLNSR